MIIVNTYTGQEYKGFKTEDNRLVFGINDAASLLEAAGYSTYTRHEDNMIFIQENGSSHFVSICAEFVDCNFDIHPMFDVNTYILPLLAYGGFKFVN
jgi:hypothetical protein